MKTMELPPNVSLDEYQGKYWIINDFNNIAEIPKGDIIAHSNEITKKAHKRLVNLGFFNDTNKGIYCATITPIMACNLGCGYCIQNTESNESNPFAPTRVPVTIMNPAVLEASRVMILDAMQQQCKNVLDILLFGGEPLLKPDLCIDILASFQKFGLASASIVTNFTVVDQVKMLKLEALQLKEIQVTLDGPKEFHDRVRVSRNGQPTYDLIVSNIEKIQLVTDFKWQIRVNLNTINIDFGDVLIADLANKLDIASCGITFGLIDDIGVNFKFTPSYDEITAKKIVSLYQLAKKLGFRVGYTSEVTRDCSYCGLEPVTSSGCVINADGTLYSCWDDLGRLERNVGNVFTGYDGTLVQTSWSHCGSTSRNKQSGDESFTSYINKQLLHMKLDELIAIQ